MLDQILQGDCLELLKTIPDNSIDLICTDPPYFGVKGGGSSGKFEWWDRQWENEREFLDWLQEIAIEWRRVLKPNGSLYSFCSTKLSAKTEVMLGEIFCVLMNIRWKKPKFSTKAEMFTKSDLRNYFPASESIIFCEHYGAGNIAKGEAGYGAKCDELRGFVFEPLRAWLVNEWNKSGLKRSRVDNAAKCSNCTQYWFLERNFQIPTSEKYQILQQLAPGYFTRPYEELRQEYEELRQEYEELRRPFNVSADVPYTDVWTFPTVQAYKGKHPCEKPAAMLEHIISASSRPNAVVLDCFAGSGSTLVAAKQLGRKFIGIEIDPHWVAVAKQRLSISSDFVTDEQREAWLNAHTSAEQPQSAPTKRYVQTNLLDMC